jgi:DNA-directed RNA polymerase subunit E'/Rpb7
MEHIYEKLCTDLLNKCDDTYGYILKIYKKIHILGNSVSSATSDVFFHVEFCIKAMKPNKGDEYTGKVCMIFSNGVFVQVEGKMKVLIPSTKLTSYTYNKDTNSFQKKRSSIKVGDELEVVIDLVKYEKQNFSCIGSLKAN